MDSTYTTRRKNRKKSFKRWYRNLSRGDKGAVMGIIACVAMLVVAYSTRLGLFG